MRISFIVFIIVVGCLQSAHSQGKVGINTISPAAMLHVKDSSVLFTGTNPLPASPGNPPVSGSGVRMMWYPNKAAFRGGRSLATEWNKDSIGIYSFAYGEGVKAKGFNSIAIGGNSSSYGISSVALGSGHNVHANYGVAIGQNCYVSGSSGISMGASNSSLGPGALSTGGITKASGTYSFTAGFNTIARSFRCAIVGSYNDTTSSSGFTWIETDPLFIVGNGTANNARKNAVTVLKNGKTGINTSSPSAMLHVKDSSVVFTGSVTLPPAPGNPPVSGPGIRMMWYPDKAAFRAGQSDGTSWDKINTGDYSFSMGKENIASGQTSGAFGENNSATGNWAIAHGNQTIASGDVSTTFGALTNATGPQSFAAGFSTTASGSESTAMGLQTTASGEAATSLGYQTNATESYSFSAGRSCTASGLQSSTMGLSAKAKGSNSVALGANVQANGYASLVTGIWNDTIVAAQTVVTTTTPIFLIGNGSANNTRSNALTVLKNGNVGIGISSPGFLLNFPNANGDKISLWGNSGVHYGLGIQSGTLQIHTDVMASDIVFGYGTSASLTETMRIKGNGRVGIGTNAPAYKLDVADRMRIRTGPGGESAGIWLNKADNTAAVSFIGMFNDNHVGIYSELGAAWNFLMNLSNGNIGIGITPTQKLHVSGNGLFTGTVTASCGVLVCSDMRYKTNIQPLTNSLSNVLGLQAIYYDWKKEEFPEKDFNDKRQIGFSAQELEKIYPEMVHTDEEGYKTVDYSRMSPVLVEAIKELKDLVDEQSRMIVQLRSELQEMKNREP